MDKNDINDPDRGFKLNHGGDEMVKAMASLSRTKASIKEAEARSKSSMAMAKALVNAMMIQQKANLMKGKIQESTGIDRLLGVS